MGENSDRQFGPNRDEIVALFCTVDDPVLSTAEVADELASTTQETDRRLVSLQNSGVLLSKSIGDHHDIWWLHPAFKPNPADQLLDKYQHEDPKLGPGSGPDG